MSSKESSFRIEYFEYKGSPNIGVFIYVNDHFALVPPDMDERSISLIRSTLNVDVYKTTVSDTILLGVMIAGNSKGILLPRTIDENEYVLFKDLAQKYGIEVDILPSRNNAVGNLVLANDNGAVVYPELEEEALERVSSVLGVKVWKRTIAGIPTVGGVGVVTNRGGIVHQEANEEEIEFLERAFGVPIGTGTVNFGFSFVKTGFVANKYGGLVGRETTGPELVRIQMVMGE
ncbi:MAG: translation initiation factor IF-6 [Desulfurococcales archaeon]|nr:translation initiation factor IF-6 [Desulfurococcales archaeon]